jgi:hypothetical protein
LWREALEETPEVELLNAWVITLFSSNSDVSGQCVAENSLELIIYLPIFL